MLFQVAAQRAAAQREHDVVELGLVRVSELLQGIERNRQRREAAFAGYLHVEQRLWCEGDAPPRLTRRLAGIRAKQADQRLHDIRQLSDQFEVLAGVVLQCDSRKLGLAGMFGPRQLPAPNGAWSRRQIEQRLRHENAGLSVHRGVVDLDVVSHIAVVETVDHRDAPQGTVAVEQLRMEPRDAVFELRLGAGAGQG